MLASLASKKHREAAKELIVRRYLCHRGILARAALARLAPKT